VRILGKKGNRNRKYIQQEGFLDKVKLLPLMVLAGIVPLVVFLKLKPVPEEYQGFWVSKTVADFFSFYKANFIMILAVLLILIMILQLSYGRLRIKTSMLYTPLALLSILIIVSTILSEYKEIAYWGFFERYEGMWVLLSYFVILIGAFLLVDNEKHLKYVLYAVGFSAVIISLIGVLQYFGMDFFRTDFAKKLILPAKLHHIAPDLKFNFEQYTIYSTLYNTNYVGSFMAMVFPMTFVFFLLAKEKKAKIILGGLSVLFFAVQIGCRSRGGMLGAAAAFVVILLLLRKQIIRNWKSILAVGVICIAVFSGMNAYSGGGLAGKIKSLQQDVSEISQQMQGENLGEVDDQALQNAEAIEQMPWAERNIFKYGRLGSSRGYIWIRTVEMMKETLLIGHGPDTFAIYFPQNDPLKNIVGLGKTMVDKPHSMYLQWGVNIGVVSLLIFLVLIKIHFIQSFVLLWKKGINSKAGIYAIGLFAAWCGYLISGVFNDSIVSVAPVFWVIFGMSMAANEMLRQN
jgi:hypothetical protein